MKIFTTWEVVGDHRKSLEEILKPNLRKKVFSKRFVGNGVTVDYTRSSKNQTSIDLYADEPDIARPIYERIQRWAKSFTPCYGEEITTLNSFNLKLKN